LALNPDHVIALAEVGKVLSYPRMQALRSIARIVEPQPGLPVVLSDPNDDPVAYTAVAAGADVLCVGDRHFYDLGGRGLLQARRYPDYG
jgi:hypothetical protein